MLQIFSIKFIIGRNTRSTKLVKISRILEKSLQIQSAILESVFTIKFIVLSIQIQIYLSMSQRKLFN